MKSRLWLVGVVLGAWNAALVWADDVANVQRGKRATALVEITRGSRKAAGTAFCVDSAGYFVTNQHVLKMAAGEIKLVLSPGEKNQSTRTAIVVREDKEADLAILKTTEPGDYTALDVGDSAALVETQQLMAFGYPFGQALATSGEEHPNISVSVGRVTSLRKSRGDLELVQLDASLNPGNSGGPVLNAKGQVVGIVRGGIPGASLNFAIPSSKLQKLLQRPDVTCTPQPVPWAKRGEEQELAMRVTRFGVGQGRGEYQVEVAVGTGASVRRYPARAVASDNRDYRARIVPLAVEKGPAPSPVTATFSGGSVTGTLADQEVRVGTRTLRSGAVARAERGGEVLLHSGEKVAGTLSGLEAARISVGESEFVVDLSKATRIEIAPPEAPASQVPVMIVVRSGETVVAEHSVTLPLELPAAMVVSPRSGGAGTVPIRPPVLSEQQVSVRLPAAVDNVVMGGGGRFLLLHIRKLRQLGVFDVSQAKVIKWLPLASDNVLVGASLEKIVLILPEQQVVQRWNLHTLEKELTVPLAETQVDGVAIGHAAQGLFMIMTRNGPRFYDLDTLKPVTIDLEGNISYWHPHPQSPLNVRSSGDGTTYAAWATGSSPSGVRVLTIEGRVARSYYAHDTAGELHPSMDGTMLFTSGGVMNPSELQIVNSARSALQGTQCLPTPEAAYFLGIRWANAFSSGGQGKNKTTVGVYSAGDRKLLFTLPDLDELQLPDGARWGTGTLAMSSRLHLIPEAKLLVTVAQSRDELILRRLDMMAEMDKAGIDYLYVSSIPPRVAKAGEVWNYPIEVKSKRGGVKLRLDSAPADMKLEGNRLTWRVPGSAASPPIEPPTPSRGSGAEPRPRGNQVSVIVGISDSSGQELFHSFSVTIK